MLDGLRGVAAFAVVWFHMSRQQMHYDGAGWPCRGYLAVDFFFILSGFVIARAYEERLASGMPLLAFARTRVLRLYPMILLALAVAAGKQEWGGPGLSWSWTAETLLPQAMLIPAWHGQLFSLDFPLWSLMFEIWANLAYALAAKTRVLRWVTPAAIGGGLLGIGVFAVNRNTLDGGAEAPLFWLGAARVAFGFFVGAALHKVMTPGMIARLPSVPFLPLAGILVAAMSIWGSFDSRYDVAVVVLVFPLIVALGTKDCVAGRWRRLALLSGALSYPVYVLHGVTVLAFMQFGQMHGWERYGGFVAATAGMAVVGYVALRWYDEPVRRLLARRRVAMA